MRETDSIMIKSSTARGPAGYNAEVERFRDEEYPMLRGESGQMFSMFKPCPVLISHQSLCIWTMLGPHFTRGH
jgi:hypothetical protein